MSSADQEPTHADDERDERHSGEAEKTVLDAIHMIEAEHASSVPLDNRSGIYLGASESSIRFRMTIGRATTAASVRPIFCAISRCVRFVSWINRNSRCSSSLGHAGIGTLHNPY
ncbi:hypothetical protein [Bradyrhizobium elkanii]|uniref:hypothetical protein n=1 Tax=Bradyrhizobium elkanii TaxID=29448 RepID=UPI001AEA4DBE|nr:hypothetical protein [Bradyrhizobium elkanii]MBP2434044.1 hypothetical protein [Bradyrhizobium elkanii]WLA89020.1 hypothetical protein QNJ96_28510 [Bradyrhizobium elkanii]